MGALGSGLSWNNLKHSINQLNKLEREIHDFISRVELIDQYFMTAEFLKEIDRFTIETSLTREQAFYYLKEKWYREKAYSSEWARYKEGRFL